ncbi:hypothetical protein PF002_g31231 [Phytophthora fragariae]|uniref:Uncharacterized protein n=1 Tax=Phytophthora fragariae TaxID=53985 RepID=A0A6A3VEE1_9STRA|nr:hypothetical protein PF002_g31231 [Phytophthora fragariae]
MASIPMRGQRGRPRTLAGSLQRDVVSDAYDIDRLLSIFTKSPGRPMKWPVMQEFEIDDGGDIIVDRRVGQVAGIHLCPHEGVYIWTATFVDGGSVQYKAEELVHAICRAHDMEVD